MMRGRCGSKEQLMSYIKQNYKQIYHASYPLEEKWINIALETYHYGIFNNIGITQASRVICEKYKCSYTRLANFIRELKLWEIRPVEDWILPICEKTATLKYKTKKATTEIWEITIDIPAPFLIKVRPRSCEDKALREVLSLLEEDPLNIPPELIDVMKCERLEEETTDITKTLEEVYNKTLESVKIEIDLLWQRRYPEETPKKYKPEKPYKTEWTYFISDYISIYKVWEIEKIPS